MRPEDGSRRPLPPVTGGPSAPEEAVDWEIEHHLGEQVDLLVAQGWNLEDARREAERRFGPRERYRRGLTRMEGRRMRMERLADVGEFVAQAAKGAARTLRHSPAFVGGVVLTLALGLGANTAMFGILDRVLLRSPDGIVNPERVRRIALTRVFDGHPSTQYALTFPGFQDLEAHTGIDLAGYSFRREVTVGDGVGAVSLYATLVSHDFFRVLGVSPVLGRFPTATEDAIGAPKTVVLSWEAWRRLYGGNRAVLGRTVEIAGDPYTVVGVAPRGFTGVTLQPVDLWLPMETAEAALTGRTESLTERRRWWVMCVARLHDGETVRAAEEQATRLHLNTGGDEWNRRLDKFEHASLSLTPLVTPAASEEGRVIRWLLGVSALVLLIACANVANLFLAHGSGRRQEVAVRLALGVSRRRLVGLRALEAVLFAGLGGALALVIARYGAEALRRVVLPDVLFPHPLGGRVLVFTAAMTLLSGVLSGLGPALQSGRTDLAAAMGGTVGGATPARRRVRAMLVVVQAALSAVLLVSAGLFVKSVWNVRSLDLGLDVDHLLSIRLETESTDLDATEQTALYRQAKERVAGLPGVAAESQWWGWGGTTVRVEGVDSIPYLPGGGPYYWAVDAAYFRTVGLRVVAGRGFNAGDVEGVPPVAVVSRSMADSLWRGRSALGACIHVPYDSGTCTRIVGVVEDAMRNRIQEAPAFEYYLPLDQTKLPGSGLYVRTNGGPGRVAPTVAKVLLTVPGVRFARVETLRGQLASQTRSWTLGATMFSVFGLLALLVAVVGLFSLLILEVAERTREVGIRMALGAASGRLIGGVVWEAVRLVALGVSVGLGAAWLVGPHLGALLFRVSPRDPTVLAGVAGALALVGLLASLVPAVRTTRVDPLESLRVE